MRKSFMLIAFLLAVATVTSCEDDEKPTVEKFPAAITPILVGKGQYFQLNDNYGNSNYKLQPIFAIRSYADWDTLLSYISEHTLYEFVETTIDFSSYKVIVVIDEVPHLSGEWSIDIVGIMEYSDKIVVTYTNLKKGMGLDVISQPYHIVKIPVSDKEIIFEYTD